MTDLTRQEIEDKFRRGENITTEQMRQAFAPGLKLELLFETLPDLKERKQTLKETNKDIIEYLAIESEIHRRDWLATDLPF